MSWFIFIPLMLFGWMAVAELRAAFHFHYYPLLFRSLHNVLLSLYWAVLQILSSEGVGLLLGFILVIVLLNLRYLHRLKLDENLQARGITKRMIYFLQPQTRR